RHDRAGASAAPSSGELASGVSNFRDTVARRHGRSGDAAADAADLVHSREPARHRSACTLQRHIEPVSSTGRRLAAARSGRRSAHPSDRNAMTAKRLIVNAFIIALVCAGVAAVYYMPQWQQSRPTQVAGKGGKKGAAGTNPSD